MFLEKSIQQISYPTSSQSTIDNKIQYSPRPMTAMATDFAMPVQQFTASPSQYTLYSSQSQQTSPINSATATPSNASPTSPRAGPPPHLPAHTRQLRPPKSPLYVPAVLRPTDPPRRALRQSPLTPPQSQDSSFDDLDNARTLSRRSTGDSGKFGLVDIEEAEWSTVGLGKVTGPPTRDHWKHDNESVMCDDARCTRYFTYFTRKHHCRRCGNTFCHLHSSYLIPVDQEANYHPNGYEERACEHCYKDFQGWKMARTSRSNSESSHGDEPATPTVNCVRSKGMLGSVLGQKGQGMAESLGASVPPDWNWSTF